MQTPDIPPENLPGPAMPRGHAVALRGAYALQLPGQTAPEEQGDSIQLVDLLRIVLKHKWTLLMVLVVAAGIAGIRTLLETPIYRSTVTLQVERVAPRVDEPGGERGHTCEIGEVEFRDFDAGDAVHRVARGIGAPCADHHVRAGPRQRTRRFEAEPRMATRDDGRFAAKIESAQDVARRRCGIESGMKGVLPARH